jgi:cytochrome c-type biogenesis protein CcmF
VAFAFAIAALMGGKLDSGWARWTRPWTLAAWLFLTLGIALGSWWAYYELGWGGWWFWDPVENASFMPWLAGTALIHSLAATEKRGVFKSWTLLLAIFAFSLSLLGTFLVRSGVLTSVHAFAADPTRGFFILLFLAFVIGGSLALYAVRAPGLKSSASFAYVSKESSLLLNNLVLISAMLMVLLGTLYPLIADALDWGKISVGPPYFNLFFVPMMAVLMLCMPLGILLKWKQDNLGNYKKMLLTVAVVSLVIAVIFSFSYAGEFSFFAVLSVFVGVWVIAVQLWDIKYQTRHAPGFMSGLKKLSRSYTGMALGHIGIAVTALGVALTSLYNASTDVRMAPGDAEEIAGFVFEMKKVEQVTGENYMASRAYIDVKRGSALITTLTPEKRAYNSDRGNMMTEAGIYPGFLRDLYVSMGEPLDGGAWSMRLHYKPFVRWVWLGALIMSLGAALSMADRRYRLRAVLKQERPGEESHAAA